jgi:ubiquinone/menaquinone biosynthesis C-methylase UbiE
MIALAEAKARAASFAVQFLVMDAAYPTLAPGEFDAVLCRHVLWSLPDIAGVLERWTNLLKPGGRLILIEGFWHTGAGLHASDITAALPARFTQVEVQKLSERPELWGGPVSDERYAVIARR